MQSSTVDVGHDVDVEDLVAAVGHVVEQAAAEGDVMRLVVDLDEVVVVAVVDDAVLERQVVRVLDGEMDHVVVPRAPGAEELEALERDVGAAVAVERAIAVVRAAEARAVGMLGLDAEGPA